MSSEAASTFSRKNPFPARHAVNRRLSGPESEKETRHHEICLEGSGLAYEVGDSLGVFASNDPALVEEIISALGVSGDAEVAGSDGSPKSLREALLKDYIITQPSKEFIKALVERGGQAVELLRTISTDPLRKK